MNLTEMRLFATAAFGMEGIVAGELRRLGLREVRAGLGGVAFAGSAAEAFLCCLRLRCADRVLWVLSEAPCESFEALYQQVKAIAWEELLPRDAFIHVRGQCARSRLMSVRDCQSVAKRAILDRLRERRGQERFPESGARFPIDIALHADVARITLDLAGEALNRRGYRTWNGEAPLRETLAAALVEVSPWRPGMPLHDPCCGTGTLLIEAAWRQAHRAPGLTRSFACEDFPFMPRAELTALREKARTEVELDRVRDISGSDIDPKALELAGRHVRQAGLSGRLSLSCQALEHLQLSAENGVFLCNPPYGERMSDRKSCQRLYHELRLLRERHPGWALCAISSDPGFERAYGRRADKKRRFYNGRLECELVMYL